ncbi:MAG: tRNA dihydrouridine(20/20a) synthase DusA [Gammaproteobacteria bacterium]
MSVSSPPRSTAPDWRFCVAPMMACTDRHYRYFARLLTKRARLYTEMVVAQALLHGPRERLLAFGASEHPVALQLGGSDPAALAAAARFGAAAGYDEINLNVGCPSDRVQAGRFGACLIREPALVADCVAAMIAAVDVPVTVKTRLGVDEIDRYEDLARLVAGVRDAGCRVLLLHARKALLNLDTRDNRLIPPLDYARVHRIKRDFPEFRVVLNGGLVTLTDGLAQLAHVDGVMLGRAAYERPLLLAEIDARVYGEAPAPVPSPTDFLAACLPYLEAEHARGTPLRVMTRHLCGVFHGRPGAREWRRLLSGEAGGARTPRDLRAALARDAQALTA